MKFVKIISVIVLLATAVACKKDHPNDIPKWLKNSIREFKRNGNSHNTRACIDGPTTIVEFSLNNSDQLFYCFRMSTRPDYAVLFDAAGNQLCDSFEYYLISNFSFNCGSYDIKNFTFKRTIWKASCR